MAAALTITQALLSRFATSAVTDFDVADSTVAGYPGGLWLEEAPEQADVPIAGMTMGNETTEFTSERDYIEDGTVDFDIYAVGSAETERLALAVRNVFDPCIKEPSLLSFPTGAVILFERTTYRIGIEGTRREDNKQIGHATFSYRYQVERTLPSS